MYSIGKKRINKGENIFHSAALKKKSLIPLYADLEDLRNTVIIEKSKLLYH